MLAAVAIVAACICAALRYVVYPSLLSPLARIPPAHPTAGFCALWIYYVRWTGRENVTLARLHRARGPILRLAPGELSVNCYHEGVKTIYGGGFDKPAFYANRFAAYGVRNLVSIAAGGEHAARRRMFAHVFSRSRIWACPSLRACTRTIIRERLLPAVDAAARRGRPLDLHALTCAYAVDLLQAYQFGLGLGANLIQDRAAREWFLAHHFARAPPHLFWISEFPALVAGTRRLGVGIVPRHVTAARARLEEWFLAKCDQAAQRLARGPDLPPEDVPLLYAQQRRAFDAADRRARGGAETPAAPAAAAAAAAPPPHRLEIASDMFDFNAATLETSGDSFAFVYQELSRRPSLQAALRQELRTLAPAIRHPPADPAPAAAAAPARPPLPSPRDLDALPLLDAIIQETLRLYPAAEGGQPRVTPSPRCTLAGYADIPPGVRVQASSYALHRNPDVFPAPEEWRPERWLRATPAQAAEMRRWFWAFGSGSRMCIGSHLARYAIKYAVAAIYSNFVSELGEEVGGRKTNNASPVGARHEVIVRFRRVADA